MVTDTTNKAFALAATLVETTTCNIFLTGKAGTGKTTFLKYIKQHSKKQLAVVAPTGVAAINAGGVTIHSFFQLPFSAFIPENTNNFFTNTDALFLDKYHLLAKLKIREEQKKILQQLELLVIDEISMVRADVLDAMHIILQHYRNNHQQPFGGVQVLFIGDLWQLPPVMSNNEWQVLQQYYNSAYFFSSKVIQANKPVYIELQKVYRQKDDAFIQLLNAIRTNTLTQENYSVLAALYNPQFNTQNNKGYITLCTHNANADAINNAALLKNNHKLYHFKAVIEGEFNEKSYPAEELLQLKVGAQVMFIKNDTEKIKRFYNGKIGIITAIEEDVIKVKCNDNEEVDVIPITWENIRYQLNTQKNILEEKVIGSFKQYPLRLAWAITIHKSQGLTFNKVAIDAAQAFAAGQVYVALSRCTGLEGLVLLSNINNNSLTTDDRILHFIKQIEPLIHQINIQQAQQAYLLQIAQQLFSFQIIEETFKKAYHIYQEGNHHFNSTAHQIIKQWLTAVTAWKETAIKFQHQLQQLFNTASSCNNATISERLQKAAQYYITQIKTIIAIVENNTLNCQSKPIAIAFNHAAQQWYVQLHYKAYLLQVCLEPLNIEKYLQHKLQFQKPSHSINVYNNKQATEETGVVNVLLYQMLKDWRDTEVEKNNLPVYTVAQNSTLQAIATYLPLTLTHLQKIKGIGTAKAVKYGLQIVDMVQRYCNEYELTTQMHLLDTNKEQPEKKPVQNKTATHLITLQLFNEKKSIELIAKERNVTTATIETHLLKCLQEKRITIQDIVAQNTIDKILQAAQSLAENERYLTAIKELLPPNISYGSIKMVMSAYNMLLQKTAYK